MNKCLSVALGTMQMEIGENFQETWQLRIADQGVIMEKMYNRHMAGNVIGGFQERI